MNADIARQRGWRWTLRRVARGGPAEAVWRISSAVAVRRWTKRTNTGRFDLSRSMSHIPSIQIDSVQAQHDVAVLLQRAEQIMAGVHTQLGVTRTDLASPDWLSDGNASVFLGDDLDGGVPSVSLKHVWELSRLAPIVDLAIAWHLTRDDRFSRRAIALLDSWTRALDDPSSALWGSGVEAGLRLISLSWITRLLATDPAAAQALTEHDRLGAYMFRMTDQVARFPSRFSSANNHALVEAAGLVVGSVAFVPHGADAAGSKWEQLGMKRLLRELDNQVGGAGLSRETATEYHAFVTEVITMTVAAFDLVGRPRPAQLVGLLTRLVGGVQALVNVGSPAIGDGDDSTVFGSDARPLLVHALDLGLAVVNGDVPADDRTAGSSVQARLLRLIAPSNVAYGPIVVPSDEVLAKSSWLVPLRSGSAIATIRSGALGYLAVAAHAHADLGSVQLSIDKRPVLIDPGTFVYDSLPQWRRYFRSTAAHNCLSVNGQDQAEYWGSFLWGTAPTATLSGFEPSADDPSAAVTHNGYVGIGCKVTRVVTLSQSALTLVDRVDQADRWSRATTDKKQGSVALTFDPDVELVEHNDDAVTLRLGQTVVIVRTPTGWTAEVVRGHQQDGSGWCSSRFGQRQSTLCVMARGPLSIGDEVTTSLTWQSLRV
jgi:hypothetical protein